MKLVCEVLHEYDIDQSQVGVFYRKVYPCRLHLADKEALGMNGYDACIWSQEAVDVSNMLNALYRWAPYGQNAGSGKKSQSWVGGYRVRFDLSMLEAASRRVEGSKLPFCRPVEIETLLWDKLHIQPGARMRLSDVADAMRVPQTGAHTALADAVRAMLIGERLHTASAFKRKVWSWRLGRSY